MAEATAQEVVWSDVDIPKTNVTVYEALIKRRMVWKYQDKPIPRDVVDRMFSTAVWAPNHRHTQPWRVFILPKDSKHRQDVAEFAQKASLARGNEEPQAQRMKAWVLNQPLLAFVYATPGEHEEMRRENYAAVACGLHNVGLAGVAEGLAVTWETGGVAKLAGLAEAVGADPEWQLVAMATIGYPDEESKSSRLPSTEFVKWSD